MKRVIIETQSNLLFRGLESEQVYDQRGGLCQVGEGDVIVVTNPIDPNFLDYWRSLGLTLPTIVSAGPFDQRFTLSELILNKKEVRQQIFDAIGDSQARLEFFWIEETEQRLVRELRITPYCNFSIAIPFACKRRFKDLCEEIGLNTSRWVGADTPQALIEEAENFFSSDNSVLVKASNGTGGMDFDTIKKVGTHSELIAAIPDIEKMKMPVIAEKLVDLSTEVTVHWEMTADGKSRMIGLFDQLSSNFAYSGAAYPSILHSTIRSKIETDLYDKFIPFLRKNRAVGYFCCDILVDKKGGIYWTDFNPRKGAILYVYDLVQRLTEIHFEDCDCFFWHEHIHLGKGLSFKDVLSTLGESVRPTEEKPFIVVTNPGIIPFGELDITGISCRSREDARFVLQNAKEGIFNV